MLDDYERERRPRVAEMTRTACIAGRLLTATVAAAGRRHPLGPAGGQRRSRRRAPVSRRRRCGPRRGCPAPPGEHLGGRPLPNPRVRTRDGRIVRLDDVLPAGWAVLGNGSDPWPLVGAELAAALARA